MILTLVIPNRDDPEKPPTLYQEWGADAVPREGEAVYLGDPDEDGKAWIVKHVSHTFILGAVPKTEVRLIEPDHWSLKPGGGLGGGAG